jgi:hypothetical protein
VKGSQVNETVWGGCSAPPHGSANLLRLQNETKINFCNAWHEMQQHLGNCDGCCEYMYHGIGDLCEIGKDIIARKLAYADTTPDWSPNKQITDK